MTSEPLEVRVLAVFDYWAAYLGGEKIKIDGLKRHTLMTYLKIYVLDNCIADKLNIFKNFVELDGMNKRWKNDRSMGSVNFWN